MERPILIQVAMKIECEELLKKIENIKEKEIKGYKFYEGIINNSKITYKRHSHRNRMSKY